MSNYEKGFSTVSLVIGLGAALFIGFGLFVFSEFGSPTETATTGRMARTAPSETLTAGEMTTTIPDIVNRGQNLECDWKMPAEAENPFNKGKLWTTGSKGRSQIDANISGMAAEANAIYQNNNAYTWMTIGGQKFGMKLSAASLEAANNSMTAQERQQAEQIRKSMIFNCKPWAPDDTKFILPADVEFQEH